MLRPSELVASPALRSWLSVVLRPRSERPVHERCPRRGSRRRREGRAAARSCSCRGRCRPRRAATASTWRCASGARARSRPSWSRARTSDAITADRRGRRRPVAGSRSSRPPSSIDLAQLAVAIGRELAGGADVALLRAHAAVRAVEAHPPDGRRDALLEHAGAALGVPLALRRRPSRRTQRAARSSTTATSRAGCPRRGRTGELAQEPRHRAARGGRRLRQAIASAHRAEELPIRSRDEVLTELLRSPSPRSARRSCSARAASACRSTDGIVAVRVEIEQPAGASADEDAGYEQRLGPGPHGARDPAVRRRRAGTAQAPRRACCSCGSTARTRGRAAVDEAAAAMRPAVAQHAGAQADGAVMRCGVGRRLPGSGGPASPVRARRRRR